ncbi:hypothetical protein OAM76_04025 [Flavobacteriaceae bacterium]|nr:hypothetical protein [Flavobacteriaceae bacterium]
MWKRFKKAGFFVSLLAVLVFILKIIFKGGYFASIFYRLFDQVTIALPIYLCGLEVAELTGSNMPMVYSSTMSIPCHFNIKLEGIRIYSFK